MTVTSKAPMRVAPMTATRNGNENSGRLDGSETIVVVDDESFMLRLACSMLTQYGYTVLSGNSAREVLHMIETQPGLTIDLALIDVVMPGMDGLELGERLREIYPKMHVIFTSSYSENPELRPEQVRDVIFIAKPFTSMTLAEKVRNVLDTPPSLQV